VTDRGSATTCPICGSDRFEPQGERAAARCHECGALERHRALVRGNQRLLARGRGRVALEIGPLNPRVFGGYLRERGWRYVSSDQSRQGNPSDPRAVGFIDFEADVGDLAAIADDAAHLVIVQHVIEEIADYRRALATIARVLHPRGAALLEIPFDPGRERSVRQSADHFGNVWTFGRDLLDVVRELFGQVTVQEYVEGVAGGRLLLCRPATATPIAMENARPGDGGWWGPAAEPGAIEGYVSQRSVRPGDRLDLHVGTRPSCRYRVTAHRLGWYGGAGGRTVAEYPGGHSDVQGLARDPVRALPGALDLGDGWPVTDTLAVSDDWTTGIYVARLLLTAGPHAGTGTVVPFVVRPPMGTTADAVLLTPVTPADSDPGAWPLQGDYQLVRYLERVGIDLAYATDLDVQREPWSLTGQRLVIASGRDGDWTPAMRAAFDAARAEGTSFAFLGAHPGDWPRWAAGGRDGTGGLAHLGSDGPPPPDVRAELDPAGGLLFSAGSAEFAWTLDDWGRAGCADRERQRFMRQALAALTA
jgi:hypothetical protein